MNARARAFGARGFSLLELAVVVCAVAILVGVALDRLLPLVGRAQRAAFLQVRSNIQSALLLQAAELITRGTPGGLAELASRNPMTLLLTPPANYLGVLDAPEWRAVPAASWYYDEQGGVLVYRVGKHTRFNPLDGPEARVDLKVSFVFDDRDGDGRFDPAHDRFEGLSLDAVQPFDWPD